MPRTIRQGLAALQPGKAARRSYVQSVGLDVPKPPKRFLRDAVEALLGLEFALAGDLALALNWAAGRQGFLLQGPDGEEVLRLQSTGVGMLTFDCCDSDCPYKIAMTAHDRVLLLAADGSEHTHHCSRRARAVVKRRKERESHGTIYGGIAAEALYLVEPTRVFGTTKHAVTTARACSARNGFRLSGPKQGWLSCSGLECSFAFELVQEPGTTGWRLDLPNERAVHSVACATGVSLSAPVRAVAKNGKKVKAALPTPTATPGLSKNQRKKQAKRALLEQERDAAASAAANCPIAPTPAAPATPRLSKNQRKKQAKRALLEQAAASAADSPAAPTPAAKLVDRISEPELEPSEVKVTIRKPAHRQRSQPAVVCSPNSSESENYHRGGYGRYRRYDDQVTPARYEALKALIKRTRQDATDRILAGVSISPLTTDEDATSDSSSGDLAPMDVDGAREQSPLRPYDLAEADVELDEFELYVEQCGY